MRPTKSTSFFTRFAKWTARATGRPAAFVMAAAVIIVWGVTGPLFKFSDTWQLVINTGTTIVTFLMVFLIQNTQNRDTEALPVKLDELIRVTKGAHLVLLDLEELDTEQLDSIYETYEELAAKAREDARRGKEDTGTPDLNIEEGDAFENGKKAKAKKKK
ncbi:MAG: low affinity iron permease family protein [Pyrinomonadaceae bacterium]